ncbi:metal-dependent hydrolase [Paenibacillus algorifonticola]
MPSWGLQTSASMLYLVAAAIGSLAPDLDHKTSTASNLIQLSPQYRRMAGSIGLLLLLVAGALWGLPRLGIDMNQNWVHSAPLWAAAGGLSFLLGKLRSLVLFGGGALLLATYALYDWHWLAAFAGGALLLLPLVKHRGIIHTPEFGLALSIGIISFCHHADGLLWGAGMGFVVGWWAHLAGDLFGKEGIQFLLLPKVKVALRWFDNGGSAERWVARLCWSISFCCWALILFNPTKII